MCGSIVGITVFAVCDCTLGRILLAIDDCVLAVEALPHFAYASVRVVGRCGRCLIDLNCVRVAAIENSQRMLLSAQDAI